MQLTAFSQLISTHPLACTLPRPPHHTCRRLPPPAATASPVAPRSGHQITHSMAPEKLEVFKSLESWVTQSVLPFLKPIEKCWQPSDFLPDPCSNEFIDQVRDLRQRTYEFPDDYLVVLVGDMITEDALPTYETWISSFDGVGDDTGCSPCPWAIWNRGWSAEENKHGDLLRTYLYLSGRVDMNMIEKTLQYLIGAGADVGTENNPYLGFVYTSFQERATFISHGNTARLAKEGGDPILARICGTIAADEKRHENAYVKIVEKLLELDPNYTMLAIAKMMKKGVTMPGYLMYDGNDPCLFKHFSTVAQRLGVYTAHDYSNILEFLIDRWELEKIAGVTGEAKRAQDYVCSLPPKIKRLQERADDRAKKLEPREVKFSWIFNNKVSVL